MNGEEAKMTLKNKPVNPMRLYIAKKPGAEKKLLEEIRRAVKKAVPGAEETIGYGVPAFKLSGNLVFFSVFRNHVGFYPGSRTVFGAFKKELEPYEKAKGTIRFPLDKPMPLGLVGKIAKFRAQENLSRKKKG